MLNLKQNLNVLKINSILFLLDVVRSAVRWIIGITIEHFSTYVNAQTFILCYKTIFYVIKDLFPLLVFVEFWLFSQLQTHWLKIYGQAECTGVMFDFIFIFLYINSKKSLKTWLRFLVISKKKWSIRYIYCLCLQNLEYVQTS